MTTPDLFGDPRAPRPCEACGVEIRFVEGPDGTAIPVVEVRRAYRFRGGKLERIRVASTIYVSHFETCPEADRFSRSRS